MRSLPVSLIYRRLKIQGLPPSSARRKVSPSAGHTYHFDGDNLSGIVMFAIARVNFVAHIDISRTYAFHTVPKLPVPSFSSRVYATDGSASRAPCTGEGML